MHIPVEITQECPQISLFNKPGAFIFKRGVQKCQSTDYFLSGKDKNMPDMWNYWEPSPVKNGNKEKNKQERKKKNSVVNQ